MKNRYLFVLLLSIFVASNSYAQNYMVDSSFGLNGRFRKAVTGNTIGVNSAKVQPDGKTLVCGCWWNGSACDSGVIFRLKTNGTPDSTFGTNGYVSKYLPGVNPSFSNFVVLSTGKIAVLSFLQVGAFETTNLLMYNSSGVQDNTFGTGGITTYSPASRNVEMYFMNKQSDDKLLIGGMTFDGSISNFQAELLRYNTNGTLDNTFGTGGIFATTSSTTTGSQDQIIVDAHDSIYLPLVDLSGAPSYYALSAVKLTPNGVPVAGYGAGGYSDTVHDMSFNSRPVLMQNGKLILGTLSGIPTGKIKTYRFSANGHKDPSYGVSGMNSFSLGGFDQTTNWYTLENNKRLMFAFDQSSTTISGTRDVVLVQADSNGNLDMSFGTGGTIRANIGTGIVNGNLCKDASGKLIVTAFDDASAGYAIRFKHVPGTGMNSLVSEPLNVKVYPNPASEILVIDGEAGIDYNVYDVAGRIVMNGQAIGVKTEVNVGTLATGVYYLECIKDRSISISKIEKY